MPPAPLRPDLLYLAVLGPGLGESLLIRVPPASWAVIDSTKRGDIVLPQALHGEVGGEPLVGIALTHPHEDHGAGLHALIDGNAGIEWLGCMESWLPEQVPTADLLERLRRGTVEHSLARIRSAWSRRPEIRWDLRAQTSRALGEATLTALLPSVRRAEHAAAAGLPANRNELCTTFLLEWRNCRLLLGADALTAQWHEVDTGVQLHDHHVYKVAHHGSETGLVDRLSAGVQGERDRAWTATPMSRGQKLPRFEDGQGVSRLLGHVDHLHLTALPFKTVEALRGRRVTRAQVEDMRRGVEVDLADGLVVVPVAAQCEAVDGVVWFGLDERGTMVDVRYGPDSLVVAEG